jgi:5-formaminoimidazole-4-carboxamide-1-beta-D-ribofuranosyl 5'-monophosphate synthetase
MVILHKDNSIYEVGEDLPTLSKSLHQFYYLKFEKILQKHNVPYKLVDYENYDGDYFIGRFAHAIPDKELHSKCFDNLYDYYGEKMWPNKKSYYYYDDKVRQYELLEKYGLHVPSVTCNDLDELLNNVTIGTVIKSTYGAGSESIFYVWEKEHLDSIEGYISNCYNRDFFPCQIQEYIDVEYEYKMVITHDEVYGVKQKLLKDWESPNKFPFGYENEHWASRVVKEKSGNQLATTTMSLDEFNFELIESMIDIQKELNTPNLKFDFLGNKATEFTYMYGEMPMTSWKYNSCNLDSKSFEERVVSLNEFSYKQPNSVLKHLGIIK